MNERFRSNHEAKFGTLLRHWFRANAKNLDTCSVELKQTESDSLPFGALAENQIDFGNAVTHSEGVLVRVQGVNGEADYIWLRKEPSYVVVKYPNCFCIITIDAFVKEKATSKRRSLTSGRAREISTYSVDLK